MPKTEDKAIMKILSFNFLADKGKILSVEPEVVTEKVYDNKEGTTILKSTFEVDRVVVLESEFSHEHALEFSIGALLSFEAGTPFVDESGNHISVTTSTSHKWNLVGKNTTETHFKVTSEFEVEPGKAVRQTAVAKKAMIDVPYTAEVCTAFGYKTTITGTWRGVSYFDLKIRQVDE